MLSDILFEICHFIDLQTINKLFIISKEFYHLLHTDRFTKLINDLLYKSFSKIRFRNNIISLYRQYSLYIKEVSTYKSILKEIFENCDLSHFHGDDHDTYFVIFNKTNFDKIINYIRIENI